MADIDDILRDALELDLDQRATLVERLLVSLEDIPEREAERLWVEVAQRRKDDLRAGRARLVDSRDVHSRAAELLS